MYETNRLCYFKVSLRLEELANLSIKSSGSRDAVILLLNAKTTRLDNLSNFIVNRCGRRILVNVEKQDSTRAVEIGKDNAKFQ